MQDWPYLNTRDFKENWRRVGGGASGSKVCMECGIPIITIGITGLCERLGRDEGFEDPLRSCLQGGRVTLVLGLPQQEGYPSTHTFLLFLRDVFTRQIGLL